MNDISKQQLDKHTQINELIEKVWLSHTIFTYYFVFHCIRLINIQEVCRSITPQKYVINKYNLPEASKGTRTKASVTTEYHVLITNPNATYTYITLD